MPCSKQPARAYQHSHPFIGPYSKIFQPSPHRHTLLISRTRFNIILNNHAYLWQAVPFRQVPRPKFRTHFSPDMRAPYYNHPSRHGHLHQDYLKLPITQLSQSSALPLFKRFSETLPICYCCVSLFPNLQHITDHTVKHSTRMYCTTDSLGCIKLLIQTA